MFSTKPLHSFHLSSVANNVAEINSIDDLSCLKELTDSGEYIVILETKDKFGQDVKDEAKTRVFSEKDELLADNQLFQITTDKEQYAINNIVELSLATAAENIWITVYIEKNHAVL